MHEQLMAMGAEIARAKHWQDSGSREHFLSALERGIELVDLSIADIRWRGPYLVFLLALREELAKLYTGQADYDVEVLSRAM
jgi:hypothetical protein